MDRCHVILFVQSLETAYRALKPPLARCTAVFVRERILSLRFLLGRVDVLGGLILACAQLTFRLTEASVEIRLPDLYPPNRNLLTSHAFNINTAWIAHTDFSSESELSSTKRGVTVPRGSFHFAPCTFHFEFTSTAPPAPLPA